MPRIELGRINHIGRYHLRVRDTVLFRRYTELNRAKPSPFSFAGSGISSGVNFAIPIDTVVQSVPNLIVYGTSVSNRF